MLREGTPNPPGAQVVLQPQSLEQSNSEAFFFFIKHLQQNQNLKFNDYLVSISGMLAQGGLQSVYPQPYMPSQYPLYGVLPNIKGNHEMKAVNL